MVDGSVVILLSIRRAVMLGELWGLYRVLKKVDLLVLALRSLIMKVSDGVETLALW